MDREDARPAADREALARIVGEPIVEAMSAPWGFANRTDLVTTASGQRLAVQRLASRRAARSRLRIAMLLDDRLRAAGIPVPRLVAGDATATPPYAITEVVAGAPGNTLLDDPTDAIALGTEMGRLATRIAAVDVTGIRLPSTWADPAAMARVAGG